MPQDLRYLKDIFLDNLSNGMLAWISDIDQTLASDTPGVHDVPVDAELVSLMNDFADVSNGGAGVLTGRPHFYTQRKLAGATITTAVENGAEIYDTNGRLQDTHGIELDAHIFDDILKKMNEAWAEQIDNKDAVFMEEHKRRSMTAQFTGVAGKRMSELYGQELWRRINNYLIAENLIHQMKAKLVLAEGNTVVEIVPKKLDKGITFERMSRLPGFAGKLIIYSGDSTADAPALEKADYGIGVTRGAPETAQHARFKNYQEFRAFMRDVIDGHKSAGALAPKRA